MLNIVAYLSHVPRATVFLQFKSVFYPFTCSGFGSLFKVL